MPRLILDTSTIARWSGPPVGIVRVEQELAHHASRHRPDVVLAFHDRVSGRLRELAPRWRPLLLGPDGAIDTISVDYRRDRPFWRTLIPGRYPLVMGMERLRLNLWGLQRLIEIEREDWARRMQRLLRRAYHAANLARERDVTLSPGLIALFKRCYDTILAEGFAFHGAQPALVSTAGKRRVRVPRRTGHNLLLRLRVR